MVYHLAPKVLPGGFVGVDIFFVISGYVVTASLASHKNQSLAEFILGFYARRIVRIFPALLICVLLASAIAVAFTPPVSWLGSSNRDTAVYSIFGLSNYALVRSLDGYFSPRIEFNPFTHTWSLAVEEQFYVIAPVIVYFWLANRSKSGIKRGAPLLLLIMLALISLGAAAYNTNFHPDRAFYLLPSRFWELACGVLLFQFQQEYRNLFSSRYCEIAGFALIMFGVVFSDRANFPFPWAMVSVVGSTLLIAGLTASEKSGSSLIEKLLSSSVAVYIGKISYSLYLWHWPVLVLLRWTVGLDNIFIMLAAFAAVFPIAAASFHFFEMPIRKLQLLRGRPWQTVTAGLAVMILIFATTSKIYASASLLSLSVTKDTATWSPYDFSETGSPGTCSVTLQQTRLGSFYAVGFVPTNCGDRSDYRRLFVIGDSHAQAYTRMLFELAKSQKMEVWLYPTTCGVANLLQALDEICRQRAQVALKDVKTKGQFGDIVFLASLRMDRLASQWGLFEISEVLARRQSEVAKQERKSALEDARNYIKQVRQLGFQVLISAPMPVFRYNAFRCSDWFNRMNADCSAKSISTHFLKDYRRPSMEALSELKNEFSEFYVWDPFEQLCPVEQCTPEDANGPLFFDTDHLTGHGNEVLYPFFVRALDQMGLRR